MRIAVLVLELVMPDIRMRYTFMDHRKVMMTDLVKVKHSLPGPLVMKFVVHTKLL